MNIVGIICEFNPFTDGHEYLISSVRRELSPCAVVCIMSGNYVQRGIPAIESKRKRAKDALFHGADLVVCIPTCISVSSASYFAKGSLEIAKKIGCTHLCFGSTNGNLDEIKKLADSEIIDIQDGNDILGAEYLRNIGSLIPYTIKINSNFKHASALRKNMDNSYLERYYRLLAGKIVQSDEEIIKLAPEISGGLENRIKASIRNSKNLDELVHNIKSKGYTYTKISRCLLQFLLGIEKNYTDELYAQVLAFNDTGRKILKKSNIKLYSSFEPEDAVNDSDIKLDIEANDLWAVIHDISIYENSDYVCKPYIIGL